MITYNTFCPHGYPINMPCIQCANDGGMAFINIAKSEIDTLRKKINDIQADRVQFCHSCLTIGDSVRCCPDAPGSVDIVRAGFAFQLKRKYKHRDEYLDALPQSVMRASIIAYKEGRNGIERHPGNTAHENAAWEWGRKDGGWENKK